MATWSIGLKLGLYTGHNPINPMAGFGNIHQPPALPTFKMGSYLYGHKADLVETWFRAVNWFINPHYPVYPIAGFANMHYTLPCH